MVSLLPRSLLLGQTGHMAVEKPVYAVVSCMRGWGRNRPFSSALPHPFQGNQSMVTLTHGVCFSEVYVNLLVLCPYDSSEGC